MARQWTGAETNKFLKMVSDGECAQAIADELGRTKYSIHNKARELNVGLAYPSGEDFCRTTVPDAYIEAIRSLRTLGFSAKDISDIFKKKHRVSTSYVKRICYGEKR